MHWHLWLAFVGASAVLMAIPGPNVALIVANSLAFGLRSGLMTVAGTSVASLIQLGLTAVGLSLALSRLGGWVLELRWVGVIYLVGLGIAHWRAPPVDLMDVRAERPRAARLLARALVVSLGNPKTLLFFGAFVPQFVAADAPAGPQLALLSASFLLMALVLDSAWALLAHRARTLLATHARWRNRLTGGVLIGAGAGLAIARGP